jgi:hypothetical protein
MSGREAHAEAFVFLDRSFDPRMLRRRVVAADQVNFLLYEGGLVDQAQKSEPMRRFAAVSTDSNRKAEEKAKSSCHREPTFQRGFFTALHIQVFPFSD